MQRSDRTGRVQRSLRAALAVGAVSLLFLGTGCSSGSTSDGGSPDAATTDAGSPDAGFPDGGARLLSLELGSEPRRVLRAAPATPRSWQVEALKDQTSLLDGDELVERSEMSARMAVSFSSSQDGPVVTLWPKVESFSSSAGTVLEDREPPATVQRFDDRGRLLSESRRLRDKSRVVLDASTLGVFTLPRTYLGVPEEAVGVGARWVQEIDQGEFVIRVEERITAVDDDALQTERTVSLAENRGRFQRVSGTTTATYETATLFLRRAQIDASFSFATTLTVDGTPATLEATVVSSLSIAEVTP